MTDDTLIADLIRAGVPAELLARVAKLIGANETMSGTLVAYETTSRTLSGTIQNAVQDYERTRKREWRNKSLNTQAKSKANDVDQPAAEVSAIPPKCPGHVPDKNLNAPLSLNRSNRSNSIEEKEREDKKRKKEVVERARGTRLPKDWWPSQDDEWFAHERGMSEIKIKETAAGFVDYWIAVPGGRGTKLDWSATWRTWIRRDQQGKGSHHGKPRKRSLAEVADDLIARSEGFTRETDTIRDDNPFDAFFAGSKTARR